MSRLTPGQVARLREAGAIVRSVVEELDTSVEKCPCCQLNRARNWDHTQAATQLTAVATKLLREEDHGTTEKADVLRPHSGG